MQFRDLKRQYLALKEDIDKAMLETAAGGAYINGAAVGALEDELAEYVGVRHCISCANGTDALSIALKVWGIGPGDAVFVPDFTFFSSAEVVAAEGALPVFVDVDPVTFNIDPQDLERRIEVVVREGIFKPRAIVSVDLFGLPADYAAIRSIADRHSLLILEDAAQGFGGSIRGRRACSFGDIATTSFFPAKPLGCYGDGGAIFTDNDDWAALAESIKVHGKGTFKYDNVRIGMNSRLDTLQAAILLVKFHAFRDYELEAVNRAAAGLTARLEGIAGVVRPSVPEGFVSSWAQYTVQLRSAEERSGLQAFLKSRDIPSMVYYPAGMHAQTAFASCEGQAGGDNRFGPLPISEKLCRSVLSLPMHPYITDGELDAIAGAVSEYSRL